MLTVENGLFNMRKHLNNYQDSVGGGVPERVTFKQKKWLHINNN